MIRSLKRLLKSKDRSKISKRLEFSHSVSIVRLSQKRIDIVGLII